MSTGKDKFGAIVGDNCRTGINVSIMPGVKIGSNSIIGPSVFLAKDVGPNTMVEFPSTAMQIRKLLDITPKSKKEKS